MSLRALHIVFIVVATVTMIGFGIWGLFQYADRGSSEDLWMGIGGIAAGILLVWYGNRFFKKLKDLKTMRP